MRNGTFVPAAAVLLAFSVTTMAEAATVSAPRPAPSVEDAADDNDMIEVRAQIDPKLLERPWNKVPFDQQYFDFTREQIVEHWETINRGLRMPLPTVKRLKPLYEELKDTPQIQAEIEKSGFNGDFTALEKRLYDQGILFLRGDFRDARLEGDRNPPAGKIIGMLSQLIYAIYLADTQQEKHSLLQEVVSEANSYQWLIERLQDKRELNDYIAAFELGRAYAIGRIAEEQPSRVVVARGYIDKIRKGSEEVLRRVPDHPMGLAFRAGLDAGIMRRVGKLTGRVTFGARQTTAIGYFERAITLQPDIAITRYEYGNAILYINKRRELEDALAQMKLAAQQRPHFAMEALDAMYAAKRAAELEDLLKSGLSFRSYERARRRFQKETGLNMTSVLHPPFLISRADATDSEPRGPGTKGRRDTTAR
ncbi:MAG: hypothetical protein ACOY3X_06430 [Pseudomonadota bacterium]